MANGEVAQSYRAVGISRYVNNNRTVAAVFARWAAASYVFEAIFTTAQVTTAVVTAAVIA